MPDKTLTCVDCGNEFGFSEKEQEIYNQRGFQEPKRCKDCRAKRRRERGGSRGSKMEEIEQMPKTSNSDKPKITDWIMGISTVMLVFITMTYVVFTYQILKDGRRQLPLAQDPVIRIVPEDDVVGEVGSFELSISNQGLSDLSRMRIFEDYFVSLTPKGGPIKLHRFGLFSVKPDTVIPTLNRGDTKNFRISFKSIDKDMTDLFHSDEKGHRMKIARLLVKFRRNVDGKEFSYSKAYVIAGNGNYLLDHDERGMSFPGGPSFADIKNVLGVSTH